MTYTVPQTVLTNNEKKAALNLVTASAKDYLTLKITLPLGNPDLKKVHTNQFLFTNLPKNFPLKNWETIANALNSEDTRMAGYTLNRWYVEGTQVSVDVSGKAELTIATNAFASSTQSYSDDMKSFTKAFTDAVKSVNNNSTNPNKNTTSSTKKTTNAVSKVGVLRMDWINKYNIPRDIYKIAINVCNVKWNDYKNTYQLYKWMDAHIGYDGYFEHKYSPVQVVKRGKGNCVDNSRLFRLLCWCIGVKCNFVQNTCTPLNHQYNKAYPGGKAVIVDCGRSQASWGSNWGGHASCGKETTTSW